MLLNSSHSARKAARSRRGFSLVELLVAVTLLMTFMAAIAMLFTTSLRAMKTGMQVIEANDEARGAFRVLERDLNAVFTSRNYGDYYSFFGTPFGMSMVGLIRVGEDYNIGRISYVIRNTGDSFDSVVDGTPINIAQLIRFIEPGVEDLDSYPIDWQAIATDPFGEYPDFNNTLSAAAGLAAGTFDAANLALLSPRDEERLNAKKRELWLRMLAGDASIALPEIWGVSFLDEDPLDYVVVSNVVVSPDPYAEPYFRYGGAANGMGAIAMIHSWYGDSSTLDFMDPPLPDTVIVDWSPLTPHLPSLVEVNVILQFESVHVGAPDYARPVRYTFDVPVGYERPIPENMQ